MESVQLNLFGEHEAPAVAKQEPDISLKAEAIAKIRAEMTSNISPYVQVVGEFLIKHLNSHPQHADKVLADGKTVTKSLDAMRTVAETKKVGNCAVLTDAEGFSIVLRYFDIEVKERGR